MRRKNKIRESDFGSYKGPGTPRQTNAQPAPKQPVPPGSPGSPGSPNNPPNPVPPNGQPPNPNAPRPGQPNQQGNQNVDIATLRKNLKAQLSANGQTPPNDAEIDKILQAQLQQQTGTMEAIFHTLKDLDMLAERKLVENIRKKFRRK